MSEGSIEHLAKSDSTFTPTFYHHLLPDIIKNNIPIPNKRNKSIYFWHARSTIKKFKHRFYIR